MRNQIGYSFIFSLALICSLMMSPGQALAQNDGNGGSISGTIIHILESPETVAGNPSVASISDSGMSCVVSFGSNMGGPDNFSMVVYSEGVVDTQVVGRMAIQWGRAHSITIENGEIVESARYDYVVLVTDSNRPDAADSWSMTLWGEGMMFDGVTFSGPAVGGDLAIHPNS